MRTIETHKVNPANDRITLKIADEPGPGGANHHYYMEWTETHPDGGSGMGLCHLHFQNGPIAEVGVNGITHETLLAILIDRLEGFQRGPYAHDDNAAALFHLRRAMEHLHARTKERMARGIEGTHKP